LNRLENINRLRFCTEKLRGNLKKNGKIVNANGLVLLIQLPNRIPVLEKILVIPIGIYTDFKKLHSIVIK